MPRTFQQWQLAQVSKSWRHRIERHKPMAFVKGSWAVCAENAWIISSFMRADIWNGWSRNTQHTSIRNDRIKGLNSGSQTSMIRQDQSQRKDRSHQRQSLGDCIIVIRVRHIWTDLYLCRSRSKRTRVNTFYRRSRLESNCVLLLMIGVFAKINISDDPRVCFRTKNRAYLNEKRRIVLRNLRVKSQKI